MTIASTISRNDYTGTGSVKIYPYTFKVFAETDLLVTQRDLSNVEAALTLNVDYTVDGVGAAGGGNVTLSVNLPSGYHLTIRRTRPLTQEADIRNQGDFFPEIHEDVFDHLLMIAQQQQDEVDRSVKLGETSPGIPVTLPVPEADKALFWNDSGDGLINRDPGSATLQIPADDSVTAEKIDDTDLPDIRALLDVYTQAQVNAVVAALIPSGTKMVFYQAAAPAGWTQDVSQDDKALRIVSGPGGGAGGSLALSAATVGNHTLTTAQIPSHQHIQGYSIHASSDGRYGSVDTGISKLDDCYVGGDDTFGPLTSTTGSGQAHNHTLALAYVDVIICEKD